MRKSQPRTPGAFQRAIYYLRTEGSGSRSHDAWAIGLGLFIGCSPIIGGHLAMCLVAGWVFGLNRVKLYLAANLIGIPLMPPVLFTELQIGSWVRRGHAYPISFDAIGSLNYWLAAQDLVIGSLILGTLLGGFFGFLTFLTLGRSMRDPVFNALVKVASDRYLVSGITAWEFARAKLRNDPVYRQVVTGGLIAPDSRVMDVGCGQGLLLALVAAARDAAEQGSWPTDWAPAPRGATLIGVELRPRIAEIAREALADAAEIHQADARTILAGETRGNTLAGTPADTPADAPTDTIVLFDVLHLMAAEEQEKLLGALVDALPPGGKLLVREADASGGWRFRFVRFGNRLTAWTQRRWTPTFHFRRAAEWRALLERFGLTVEDPREMGTASFANVLLVGIKRR
jgi:SAM-dependent methyltransferase